MTQAEHVKTVCQGCEGKLELPINAVGVTFACPRCGTYLQLALKCACINCGGPLSFEVGHIGHTIQCGHCNGQTPLMPSAILADAPPSKPSEPEPELEPKPKKRTAADTQPLPVREPTEATPTSDGPTPKTHSAPQSPSAPKRPGGAGSPGGATAPAPKRPSSSEKQGASAPPKRPSGAGGPTAPVSGPPKRPGAAADQSVPDGVKPPGQAPKMPKMGGGSDASGAPPKRPAADAGPQKKGVASPSAAAASRQAAIAQSKAKESEEPSDKTGGASSDRIQLVKKTGVGIGIAAAVGGLAWFVVMPYLGSGGSNLLIQASKRNPNTTVFRPVFDASAIKVDPGSLSVRSGDAGLKMLSGSVKNSGSESARNIKITVQIAGNEITHTVNKEVRPGQSVEFEAPLSFEPPLNPQITVKKIEIH